MSQLPPLTILAKGLETMLYNKVHKHPEMAQPIKDYERAGPTAPIRTYEWLSTEVRRTVNLEQMRKNLQERDDRMRELAKGKAPTQAAVGQAEEKPKREKKREKSVKADLKDPAPATLSPAREKGKAGKGAHANENRALGKGGNPSGDAPRPERAEQSVYHCYWFHHADGCKRKDCKFKHDKRIPNKELEDLKARNLDQKRATSAPPAGKGEKGDSKGGGKKICYEFRKSGSCAKGDDCAYEHSAPAEAKGPKARPPAPQKAFGTPAISIFDLEDGHFCLAVGEDSHKQVRFEKQKMTRGTRQKCQRTLSR